jgi:ribosomal-protein-alanine N-acetyltransferase
MGVLPPARRHGLGTALLNAAREFAREAGITRLALDVWAFNADAREFYEQHGFVVMRQELWTTVDEGG